MAAIIFALLFTVSSFWLWVELNRSCRIQKRLRRANKLLAQVKITKDQKLAANWNLLWGIIRQTFHIHREANGKLTGGKPALRLFHLLRSEYGTFSLRQMEVMKQMVVLLDGVVREQRERQAALCPVGREILFDAEGGFTIKPSKN